MTTLLDGSRGTALDDDVDLVRDRVLVERAQAGDRSAFDDLYLRYYRRLYRFCLRRLQDAHEAEDVTQESFARAWRALPSFAGDRRFYPWLSVIASHLCTDVARRRSRSTPVAEFHQAEMASTDDGGEELMVAAVDSDLVAKAFLRLSTRHQRILRLREGSGWSYQMIADHEGVGITAIETLLWRARQALKREFALLADLDGRFAGAVGALLGMGAVRRLVADHLASARRMAHSHPWPVAALGSAAAASVALIAVATPGALSAGSPPPPSPSITTALPSTHRGVQGRPEGMAAALLSQGEQPRRALAATEPARGAAASTAALPGAGSVLGSEPDLDASGTLSSLGTLVHLGSLGVRGAARAAGSALQGASFTVDELSPALQAMLGSASPGPSTTTTTDVPVVTSLAAPRGATSQVTLATEAALAGAVCDIRASVSAVTSILTSPASGPLSSPPTASSCPR